MRRQRLSRAEVWTMRRQRQAVVLGNHVGAVVTDEAAVVEHVGLQDIHHAVARHVLEARQAGILLAAGAIRFKPILLTAIAAMIGAVVILADPIFQGLAISLLFGLASSTALTVLVIPAIYMVLRYREPETVPETEEAQEERT